MRFHLLDSSKCVYSGHPELDLQQRWFIETGNKFLSAFNRGVHMPIIEKTLLELTDYTKKHFITQEAYMELYDYPPIEEHIVQHYDYLLKVAKTFKDLLKYKNSSQTNALNTLSTSIAVLITDWYEFHILDADKRLNEFIRYEVNKKR